MCNAVTARVFPRIEYGPGMTAIDADNLAIRMRRITELSETMLAVQTKNEHARTLAEYIPRKLPWPDFRSAYTHRRHPRNDVG